MGLAANPGIAGVSETRETRNAYITLLFQPAKNKLNTCKSGKSETSFVTVQFARRLI
jgi:hypothetical protein